MPAEPALDPALRDLLTALDDGSPFDLARARAALDDFAAAVGGHGPAAGAVDLEIAGVRVRCYDAHARPGTPQLLWFHGGGWVTGSLAAVDPICRTLVARTAARVLSVDYRLAPEHPFPAALDDCVAVLREVAARGPVAVGGDSVGGGLAAAACRVVRDEGLPVVAQVLLTPLLDATLSCP